MKTMLKIIGCCVALGAATLYAQTNGSIVPPACTNAGWFSVTQLPPQFRQAYISNLVVAYKERRLAEAQAASLHVWTQAEIDEFNALRARPAIRCGTSWGQTPWGTNGPASNPPPIRVVVQTAPSATVAILAGEVTGVPDAVWLGYGDDCGVALCEDAAVLPKRFYWIKMP